ncbi:hypothetical protein R3O68_10420 [Corynebacterium simulans]
MRIKFCTGAKIGEAWPGSTDYDFFGAQLYTAWETTLGPALGIE